MRHSGKYIHKIVLTRFPERIFNPMRYIGIGSFPVRYESICCIHNQGIAWTDLRYWYAVLIRGADTRCWYAVLIRGTDTQYRYTELHYWYMVLQKWITRVAEKWIPASFYPTVWSQRNCWSLDERSTVFVKRNSSKNKTKNSTINEITR